MVHTVFNRKSTFSAGYVFLLLGSLHMPFIAAMDSQSDEKSSASSDQWWDDEDGTSKSSRSRSGSQLRVLNLAQHNELPTNTSSTSSIAITTHAKAENEIQKNLLSLKINGGFIRDIVALNTLSFQNLEALSITHTKDLNAFATVQTAILDGAPNLRVLILNRNPLQGTCALSHKNLEKLQVNYTDTASIGALNLPKATLLDFDNNLIQKVDMHTIICQDGAHISFAGNHALKEVIDMEDIKQRKLHLDLLDTPIRIDSLPQQLSMFSKMKTSAIGLIVRSDAMFIGSALGLLCKYFTIRRMYDPFDRGCFRIAATMLIGIQLFKIYAPHMCEKKSEVLIACDDGCFYADNRIEKKRNVLGHNATMPWYVTDKKE